MTKPLLDRKATDQLNLAVLRRVDPDTEQVLTTAGHVALYGFDTDKKAWVSPYPLPSWLFSLDQQTSKLFAVAEPQGCGRLAVLVEEAKSTSLQNSHPKQEEPR